jgi:hypothetical protein
MPGAGANRRPAAWVNKSRAVALSDVLESARYHAKAGTEARGRQIAEAGGSPIGWPTDRRFAAAAARRAINGRDDSGGSFRSRVQVALSRTAIAYSFAQFGEWGRDFE